MLKSRDTVSSYLKKNKRSSRNQKKMTFRKIEKKSKGTIFQHCQVLYTTHCFLQKEKDLFRMQFSHQKELLPKAMPMLGHSLSLLLEIYSIFRSIALHPGLILVRPRPFPPTHGLVFAFLKS